jgi:ArsR family transcriptional regulator, cadmium/lead-responsive transcriptional repressor
MAIDVTSATDVVSDSPFTLADSPSRTELLAKYFRGLGDPTRLRILRLLDAAGELSAGELVKRLGMPQATVSTHLGCLRWCGFVTTRREDRSVIYSLADGRVSELVEVADSLLEDNAEHVACCRRIDSDAR